LSHFEKQGEGKNGCSGKALHIIITLTSQVTQQGPYQNEEYLRSAMNTKGFPFNVTAQEAILSD